MIVSHDAFKGTDGFFEIFRESLHGALYPATHETAETLRKNGVYDDQSSAINVLMKPVIGEVMPAIPAEMCAPLADALEQLAPKIVGHLPYMQNVVAIFVNGLRDAHDANEPLTFVHADG